jgi:hypothetical protein
MGSLVSPAILLQINLLSLLRLAIELSEHVLFLVLILSFVSVVRWIHQIFNLPAHQQNRNRGVPAGRLTVNLRNKKALAEPTEKPADRRWSRMQ